MLLLLRLVSANNCSNNQGCLRIVEIKELACIYDLPEFVYYYCYAYHLLEFYYSLLRIEE